MWYFVYIVMISKKAKEKLTKHLDRETQYELSVDAPLVKELVSRLGLARLLLFIPSFATTPPRHPPVHKQMNVYAQWINRWIGILWRPTVITLKPLQLLWMKMWKLLCLIGCLYTYISWLVIFVDTADFSLLQISTNDCFLYGKTIG